MDRERQIGSDQIGVLQRAKHRKAPAKGRFDHGIDGFGVANALLDKRDGLAPQRVLQAIADESGHVLFHMRRFFPGGAMQLHGPGDRLGRRPLRFDHLHQRNKERRIPPMRSECALTALEAGHDRGDWNDRGVAGKDRIRANMGFDRGEQFLFQRQIFEHRLDDVIDAANRLTEIDARPHPSHCTFILAEVAQIGGNARCQCV